MSTIPPPRSSSTSKRRDVLLLAARDVFVKNGYHTAAMDDIAIRAGVSKPVLYQHFASKLDLYLALVDEQAKQLIQRVTDAIAASDSNKARVRNTLAAYFEFVDTDGAAFRLIFESDLRQEPAAAALIEQAYRSCTEAIAELICADTGVSKTNATFLAVGLAGAAEMAARYWLDSARAVPKNHAVEMLFELTWRGISGFPLAEQTADSVRAEQ